MGLPLNIGPFELLLVLIIALVILGPGKLPEVGSAMGRTIREFRRASSDVDDATRLTASEPARPVPTSQVDPRSTRDAAIVTSDPVTAPRPGTTRAEEA